MPTEASLSARPVSDPLDFTDDYGCGFDQWLAERDPDGVQRLVNRASAQELMLVWREEYEREIPKLARSFVGGEYWQSVLSRLRELDADHRHRREPLLAHPPVCGNPQHVAPGEVQDKWDCTGHVTWKDFDSVRDKLFRKNRRDGHLDGTAREHATPVGPWCIFDGRVSDLVRTTIVVRRFDGIQVVAKMFSDVATDFDGVRLEAQWRATPAGYHAHHIDVVVPVRTPHSDSLKVEIQLCSQLQEVLRDLTHTLYAKYRCDPNADSLAWQHDPYCEEFTPNYLGHLLHLADGLIVKSQPTKPGERIS